jgi:hypothetical protein
MFLRAHFLTVRETPRCGQKRIFSLLRPLAMLNYDSDDGQDENRLRSSPRVMRPGRPGVGEVEGTNRLIARREFRYIGTVYTGIYT